MKHVLIADDHEVTRRGVREIVADAFEEIEIAEAVDAPSVLAQLAARPWDLILLDAMMPGGNIVDLIARIRAASATVPILVLTAVTEIELVLETMKAGANGFLGKHHASDVLVDAIRKLAGGERYLPPDTAAAVAAALGERKPEALHGRLSERELEIFLLIARGRSIKESASELHLSDKTVATYVARIREKTGLTSYVDIARYALQHKLVD